MNNYVLETLATEENFDEAGYLAANPDVEKAVKDGNLESGLLHFQHCGRAEGRHQRPIGALKELKGAKAAKLERIRVALRDDMPSVHQDGCVDFLTDDLRKQFNIVDTENVSSNRYDDNAKHLIRKYEGGLILDCGAGRRGTYYDNVVNFEIVAYDTTDVRGVGEKLPFKDNSFDAVFSLAVLEHVKDPFQCAREIIRVLKPGGELYCCVPFLQPMHGYPHHYYNMTEQGIRNLFEPSIRIDDHHVNDAMTPIHALTWIVRSWAEGLSGNAREQFLGMKLSDLLAAPTDFINSEFVQQLSREKNFELACATVILGTKI